MLFLILSDLVALAVAITQPRPDSQESEHPGSGSECLTPLNGIYVFCQKHHQEIVTCVFEKKRLEFFVL